MYALGIQYIYIVYILEIQHIVLTIQYIYYMYALGIQYIYIYCVYIRNTAYYIDNTGYICIHW